MLERIKRVFGFKDIKNGRTIIVNSESLEDRVAVTANGTLEEYTIERKGHKNIAGNIYKGRVKNIEQGLKAMFVDIGLDKNAFLHFWDAIPAALDDDMEQIRRGKKKNKRITSKDIPNIYPVGSEVLVQVTKGPIGNKGPRVTTNISLPGRFMVLMPLNDQFGISRKIEDPKERKRLRKITENLSVPEGMGIIMRTVCQGKRARYFVRDIAFLLEQWEQVDEIQLNNKAPVMAFEEPNLIEKTVRDFLTDDVDEVLCDDIEVADEMRKLAATISKRARKRIQHYQGNVPIFDKLGIQKQIDNAFLRQVWLPCGGYLVIDETEALIAIDVNTGRNKGSKDVDRMILETNLEAAEEVARQLRLRNIGGLVVIDFIDMRQRRDQNQVYKKMKDHLYDDKAKTQVCPISPLGLMELTRQRLNESLTVSQFDICPTCLGKGTIKSAMTMSVELQRTLSRVLARRQDEEDRDLLTYVHPEVLNRLRTEDDKLLVDLERRYGARLTFRGDPSFNREQIKVLEGKSGKEIQL
ncbi:MAG: Rne/Rng family ribonuclease [Verrucomicrobiota bacterium]